LQSDNWISLLHGLKSTEISLKRGGIFIRVKQE